MNLHVCVRERENVCACVRMCVRACVQNLLVCAWVYLCACVYLKGGKGRHMHGFFVIGQKPVSSCPLFSRTHIHAYIHTHAHTCTHANVDTINTHTHDVQRVYQHTMMKRTRIHTHTHISSFPVRVFVRVRACVRACMSVLCTGACACVCVRRSVRV